MPGPTVLPDRHVFVGDPYTLRLKFQNPDGTPKDVSGGSFSAQLTSAGKGALVVDATVAASGYISILFPADLTALQPWIRWTLRESIIWGRTLILGKIVVDTGTPPYLASVNDEAVLTVATFGQPDDEFILMAISESGAEGPAGPPGPAGQSSVYVGATPPDHTVYPLWVDSTVPSAPVLKVWISGSWVAIGGSTVSGFMAVDDGTGTITITAQGNSTAIDHGDGTLTFAGSGVTDNGDGTYTLGALS